MTADITAIVTGHREGRLAVASLRSALSAVAAARSEGRRLELLLILDRPDPATRAVFQRYSAQADGLQEVDFGDQGMTRNAAITAASGARVACLDADDLWTEDWLWRAAAFLDRHGPGVIAHPAYNYFFEGQATIFRHIDQDDPEFSADFLRVVNYWDALCLCDRDVHLSFPYAARDVDAGWAYEDWHWNCETVAAGLRHKTVPGTVLFKRRKPQSQTLQASGSKAMMRRSRLSSYAQAGAQGSTA